MVPFKMHFSIKIAKIKLLQQKLLIQTAIRCCSHTKGIIVRLRNKRLRVSLLDSNLYTPIKMVPFKMHIFLFKSLKSSCYNKNSGFKWLSDVVLIQKVSIFHSEIA